MTIQPECSAFEFLSSTAAPTPSPSSIRIRVPTNSAKYACTSSSSLERTTRRDVARRLQVPFHVLVELEERHAEARHLERGHVLADVGHLVYIHSLALQGIGEVGVSYVELHERRAAEAVDHHSDVSLRSVPGSPWMPIPISISSSPISKIGSPDSGGMQLVSAIPIERMLPFTRSAISFTPAKSLPSSAAAPAILCTKMVLAMPRRPLVYVESSTATSSLVTT